MLLLPQRKPHLEENRRTSNLLTFSNAVEMAEPLHVFCQGLGAGVLALLPEQVCSSCSMVWGTGQCSATVAQTSIRGLDTA
jgi:hypothetical protein